jgi:hypothetical protein
LALVSGLVVLSPHQGKDPRRDTLAGLDKHLLADIGLPSEWYEPGILRDPFTDHGEPG